MQRRFVPLALATALALPGAAPAAAQPAPPAAARATRAPPERQDTTPHAHGATPRARLTSVDVYRACRNPQPTLARLCSLKMPGDQENAAAWREWLFTFRTNGSAIPGWIRYYAGTAETEEILALGLERLIADSASLARVADQINRTKLDGELGNLPPNVRSRYVALRTPRNPAGTDSLLRPFLAALPQLDTASTQTDTLRAFDRAVRSLTLPNALRLVSVITREEDFWFGKSVRGAVERNHHPVHRDDLLARSVTASRLAESQARTGRSSAVLWGTTEFVMNRAEQQFRLYAIRGIAGRLCGQRNWILLPESCSLLQAGSMSISSPGLGLLRHAVVRDMRALPHTALWWMYVSNAGDPRMREHGDEIHSGIVVTRFVVETARGRDPVAAFAAVADSMAPAAISERTHPSAAALLGYAALLGSRVESDSLRKTIGAEDLRRYELIATAANLGEARALGRFVPWRFLAMDSGFTAAAREIRDSRKSLSDLRLQQPDSSPQVVAAREALLGAMFTAVDGVLVQASEGGSRADVWNLSTSVREVMIPLVDDDHTGALLALNRMLAPYLRDAGSDFNLQWMRGMSFLANMSAASSSDQVNAALMALVSPGGYVTKRTAPGFRFSLNAFAGLYGGPPLAWVSGEGVDGRNAWFGGPYLPIGVEVGLPRRYQFFPSWGRLGIFAQVIDLGALASWRFGHQDEVENEPQVGLSQVFSPGAFIVYDVAGVPLSIGYGWSLAPELRTVNQGDAGVTTTRTALRRGVFFAFDVPLFP